LKRMRVVDDRLYLALLDIALSKHGEREEAKSLVTLMKKKKKKKKQLVVKHREECSNDSFG